jgi:hypothetical protein
MGEISYEIFRMKKEKDDKTNRIDGSRTPLHQKSQLFFERKVC